MDSTIPTPALIVDLDKLEDNTKRMLDKTKKHNLRIRPHIKTHKTIEGALYQLFGKKDVEDTQSFGITVSTLGEAEFFASSGKFSDILYAVPLSPNKFQKAFEISNKISKFSVFVDNESVAQQLIHFAKEKGFQWNVWLKVDAGYNRAGVKPFEPNSLALAKLLNSSPQIHFMGIYSHSGDSYSSKNAEEILISAEKERKVMASFAQLLRNEGISLENVAIGSTPACSVQENFEGITEIHPGNYIFYDRFQASIGACTLENIACSVLSSVLSHYPAKNRFMIDAGALALSKDIGPTEGKDWGHIVGHPNLVICSLSQEVGLVETRDGSPINFDLFPVGSTINILPNHSCLTAALYPKYYVQKQGKLVDVWTTCPRSW